MGELVILTEWQGRAQQQARVPAVIRMPGAASLAVTVTDLAPEGACVELPPVPLPSFFLLQIDGLERVERICRTVWRDERSIGVRFVNARTMGRSRRRPLKAPETIAVHPASRSTVTAASNSARL
jgi:hypothetical protein